MADDRLFVKTEPLAQWLATHVPALREAGWTCLEPDATNLANATRKVWVRSSGGPPMTITEAWNIQSLIEFLKVN